MSQLRKELLTFAKARYHNDFGQVFSKDMRRGENQ